MTENLIFAATEQVLHPLVVGGELRPLPPVGSKRALEHAQLAADLRDFTGESANEIQWQRLRVARRLCPIDRLPAPGRGEWLLVFALSDLLQATNPDLTGMLGRDRPAKLVELALESTQAAGGPRTVGEALGRHASFSRVLELVRIDTQVSWWVGSRTYRGAVPPARVLAWKSVRRVRSTRQDVSLTSMIDDGAAWSARWLETLGAWLAASPLTDLANVTRSSPEFTWTGSILGLIATAPGRTLARRALELAGDRARVTEVLTQATQKLAQVEPRGVEPLTRFVAELEPSAALARAP